MTSTWRGLNLFGSGPHRFRLARQGQSLVPNFILGLPGPGSQAQGLVELDIFVEGRLVSATSAGLWTLRDAIVAEITDPVTAATLIDKTGRAWDDMALVGFAESGPADRGRLWSVAYTAQFRRFA